jgi:predicted RNA-binding protein with TRAM domain
MHIRVSFAGSKSLSNHKLQGFTIFVQEMVRGVSNNLDMRAVRNAIARALPKKSTFHFNDRLRSRARPIRSFGCHRRCKKIDKPTSV